MSATARCDKAACPIATGGRCLEGFADPAEECPNYNSDTVVDGVDESASGGLADPQTSVTHSGRGAMPSRDMSPIHAGAALSTAEAAEIARRALTRVVVVAGVEESGKSSLVTCAFHHLLEAPFAGYSFAGSRTLPAFDERCHRARIDSERAAPTMGRTSSAAGTQFLHLRLARESDAGGSALATARDLLLTDVSGEAFRRARDNAEDAQKLPVLRRADRLAVLVDGAKLGQSNERQGAWRDAASLLRSLLDAEMVDSSTAVDVVVTKWDLVTASERADDAIAYVASLEQRGAPLAMRLAELRWHRVAALPTRAGVALGFGVDTLVRAWMEDSHLLLGSARHADVDGHGIDGLDTRDTAAGAQRIRQAAQFAHRYFRRTDESRGEQRDDRQRRPGATMTVSPKSAAADR